MSQQPAVNGPLDGIRILDLSSVIMGPYATQVLADLGADVIKIEPPSGDSMRDVNPMVHPKMGAIFLHLNRNKRSVVLDLKTEAGLQACFALIKTADILLFNIRPKAMQKLGLSYDQVKQINPKIVYLGAVGFGANGPYAGQPAYDDVIQGMTGIADLYQKNSHQSPRYAPITLADRAMGLHVAIAALAGYIDAQRSGQGQAIEIPMFEGMAQLVLGDHLGGKTFIPAQGTTGYARLLSPERKPYQTADGYLVVLIYNHNHWQQFFRLINQAHLIDDPRYNTAQARSEHINELYQLVATHLLEKPTRYWLENLKKQDIPAAPLYSVDDLIDDPHITSTQAVTTLSHPTEGMMRTPSPLGTYTKTPLSIRTAAPTLGQHTDEILGQLNLLSTPLTLTP